MLLHAESDLLAVFKRNPLVLTFLSDLSDRSCKFFQVYSNASVIFFLFFRRLKDENGEYMRIFWLDATEQNGTIYLIGKVAVPSTGNGKTTYLSACVAIHGIEREVLVLPR